MSANHWFTLLKLLFSCPRRSLRRKISSWNWSFLALQQSNPTLQKQNKRKKKKEEYVIPFHNRNKLISGSIYLYNDNENECMKSHTARGRGNGSCLVERRGEGLGQSSNPSVPKSKINITWRCINAAHAIFCTLQFCSQTFSTILDCSATT